LQQQEPAANGSDGRQQNRKLVQRRLRAYMSASLSCLVFITAATIANIAVVVVVVLLNRPHIEIN